MYIVDDVWYEIKTFLFHNIKFSKHLSDNIHIKTYNSLLTTIPKYTNNHASPKIVFCSNNSNFKIKKSLFHVINPHTNKYWLLLEYSSNSNIRIDASLAKIN
ncbi:MAG: hypothetical protein CMF82_03805 [Candidatus Marinimicrobia bacterium]|nr:hypothetical protein [Candidatus Neomarinimicrobiota bacterium]|tara:strand:+ start:504 stop:809 length:306 start_codon:yes stop_codon:yes gene_type:complete